MASSEVPETCSLSGDKAPTPEIMIVVDYRDKYATRTMTFKLTTFLFRLIFMVNFEWCTDKIILRGLVIVKVDK